MTEATEATKPEPTAQEKKFASTAHVVTHETVTDYKVAKMFPNAAKELPAENTLTEVSEAKPEVVAKTEPEKKDVPEQKEKQDALDKRFSKLTAQREEAKREAQEERAKREALEKRIADLEAGKKPEEVKKDADAEPDPKDYDDAFKFAKDLAKWETKQALKQRDADDEAKRQAAEREAQAKEWKKRQDAFASITPNYAEVLAESDVKVSDQVRDAILESDVGPHLLYHLASNPDDAEELQGMSVAKALRYIGKLEAKLEKAAEKPTPAVETIKTDAKGTATVQITKAPTPITPIRSMAAASDVPLEADGRFTGTHKQYKALRKAGKI